MSKLEIKQVRSTVNTLPSQRRTLEALGLRGIGRKVEREDSPQLRGQLEVVGHLVEVEGS